MWAIFIRHVHVNISIFMQMEERCFEAQPIQFRWIEYEANQLLWKVRGSPSWEGQQLTISVQYMTGILCISRIQRRVILQKAKLHLCHATSKTTLVLVTCFIVYGCISWFLVLSGFYVTGLSRNLFWILFLQKGKKRTFPAHQKNMFELLVQKAVPGWICIAWTSEQFAVI